MKTEVIGKSVAGQSLELMRLGEGDRVLLNRVLLIGGVHGNEPEGVALAKMCLAEFSNQPLEGLELCIFPSANPDGLLMSRRVNLNGVDLNRNLPSNDWSPEAFNKKYPPGERPNSEPENQALVAWLEANQPNLVISFHSFEKTLMNINGDCEEVAKQMKSVNALPIETTMGYPTPGCLGTYAGLERAMPTITYEILRGMSLREIYTIHFRAIQKGLEFFAKKGAA